MICSLNRTANLWVIPRPTDRSRHKRRRFNSCITAFRQAWPIASLILEYPACPKQAGQCRPAWIFSIGPLRNAGQALLLLSAQVVGGSKSVFITKESTKTFCLRIERRGALLTPARILPRRVGSTPERAGVRSHQFHVLQGIALSVGYSLLNRSDAR